MPRTPDNVTLDTFSIGEQTAAARKRAAARKAGIKVAEPADPGGTRLTAAQREKVNKALANRKRKDEAKDEATRDAKRKKKKAATADSRAAAASAGNFKARVDQTADDVNAALRDLRRSR